MASIQFGFAIRAVTDLIKIDSAFRRSAQNECTIEYSAFDAIAATTRAHFEYKSDPINYILEIAL